MSFINMSFLIALLALAVPILIHLFNRRFSKRRTWAAMLFLDDSFSSRKSRIVLEESLVLAIRTLLITFLVLSLARPLITHSSGIPWGIVFITFFLGMTSFTTSFAVWRQKKLRKVLTIISIVLLAISIGLITIEKFRALSRMLKLNPQDVVLIIDGSASMSRIVDGSTLFDKAVKEAEQVIKTSNSGTSFSIIVAGTEPIVRNRIPLSDRNALLTITSQLTPPLGSLNITASVKTALSSLARGNHFGKTVILFTDGQKKGWASDIPSIWRSIHQSFSELPSVPRFVLKTIKTLPLARNLAISKITFPNNSIGINTATSITVTIENTGNEAVTAKDLKLIINDKELTKKSIGQLRPGASTAIHFSYKFKRSGTEVVTARLNVDDEISWDNQRFSVQHVIDKIKVLIVDSGSSIEQRTRSSFFTQLGLTPASLALTNNSEHNFLFEPTVINATELINYNNFYNFDAIILCDVPRLPTFTADKISEFVSNGGGLLITPGARCIPKFYNEWQWNSVNFLPAKLIKHTTVKKGEVVSPLLDSIDHPVLKGLIETMANEIKSLSLKTYWRLDYQEFDSSINVGALLSNNTPFLMDKTIGNGRVLMYPIMFDNNDSALVLKDCFVPILHESLHFLTRIKNISFNIPTKPRADVILNQNVTASLSNVEKGLKTEFFADPIFKEKISSSTESNIEIIGETSPVLRHYNGEFISIRWEGTLIPGETGLYTIIAEAKGEINLWINNTFILQTNKKTNGLNVGQAQLPLTKKENYNIRVEYIGRGTYAAKMLWDNGNGKQLIPADVFGHHDSVLRQNRSAAVLSANNGAKRPIYIDNRKGKLTAKINSSQPGLYRLFIPEKLQRHCQAVTDVDNNVPINILLDIDESRFQLLSEKDFESLSNYIDLIPVQSISDIEKVLSGADIGSEFWKHLLLAALILLLVELVLTRWIAIQRKSGEELKIDFDEHKKPSKSFLKQLSLIKTLKKGK